MGTVDDVTGFEISYAPIGAAEYKDKQYYVLNMEWLVDNNHWSYIGNLAVSASGDEIYDTAYCKDKSIIFSVIRWQK